MIIRPAEENDWPEIWEIFRDVVSKGDTYAYPVNTTEETARASWMSSPAITYVATNENGNIVGTYIIKPNQPGLGSHVANAGFMVSSKYRGSGLGRAMGEHAMKEAKQQGFLAMQFNSVVSTNIRAVSLWKSLGFKIIGTIPLGFKHIEEGLVDIYIMHRFL